MPLSGQVSKLRRFALIRDDDPTGRSGKGWVALGIEFPDGTVVFQWLDPGNIVTQPRGIEAALDVHGHEGKTRVHWIDDAPDA